MPRPYESRPQSRNPSLDQPAQVLHSPHIRYAGERWEDERPKLQQQTRVAVPSLPGLPWPGTDKASLCLLIWGCGREWQRADMDDCALLMRVASSRQQLQVNDMAREEAVRLPPLPRRSGSSGSYRETEQQSKISGDVKSQAVGLTLHTATRR